MKKISHERGKAVEVYKSNNIDFFHDQYYYTTSSDVRCKKHPDQLSSVGVCAYCLKDRLINLVCSDYGVDHQRLSFSSNSEIATTIHRTSCAAKPIRNSNNNAGNRSSEEMYLIKRSNSSCVEIKKKNGFWKIGSRLFKKKRDQDCDNCGKSTDGSGLMSYSAARSSDFNGGLRFSGGGDDDLGFIDLKFDFEAGSKTKRDICAIKKGVDGGSIENAVVENGAFYNASSCQKNRRSFKGWRWIFKAPEK